MADINSTGDNELDAIYDQVMHCEAAIAPQDVERLADLVLSNEVVGRNWRLTALLAGKDGEFYRELSEDEGKAEALAPATESLRDFAKLLRQMADLADSASARIMVAGCNHEHFTDWIAESE
jgi:hypothetical protein